MDKQRARHRPGLQVSVGRGARGGALLGHGTWEAETQHQPHSAPGQGLGEVGGRAQASLTWRRG